MIEKLYDLFLKANQNISTDSRNISPGCVFFALRGENFDGNKYAHDALTKGAIVSVIDNPEYENENTFLVDDVLKTLQALANYHRKKSTFKVFGLTGTNGKTTTKELIHCVLSKKYNCFATKGNLNNHIGVPLTLLSTPAKAQILIVEMGANHQGEIAELCNIAEPDLGLITNIGKAHLEGFGGFEGVKKTKSELYNFLKSKSSVIFHNSTDPVLNELVGNYAHTIKYGDPNSACFISKSTFDGTLKIDVLLNNQPVTINSNLFGEYNVSNILTAMCVGIYFNVDVNDIKTALDSYTPSNNRSQILKTHSNTLILDSYNANPSSMEAALISFDKIKASKKIIILGEMKELGIDSESEHRKIIKLAQNIKADRRYFVGQGFEKLNIEDSLFRNTSDLIQILSSTKIENTLIFIKGSRSNKLERLIEYL